MFHSQRMSFQISGRWVQSTERKTETQSQCSNSILCECTSLTYPETILRVYAYASSIVRLYHGADLQGGKGGEGAAAG